MLNFKSIDFINILSELKSLGYTIDVVSFYSGPRGINMSGIDKKIVIYDNSSEGDIVRKIISVYEEHLININSNDAHIRIAKIFDVL